MIREITIPSFEKFCELQDKLNAVAHVSWFLTDRKSAMKWTYPMYATVTKIVISETRFTIRWK
jgi:hypothetical protein